MVSVEGMHATKIYRAGYFTVERYFRVTTWFLSLVFCFFELALATPGFSFYNLREVPYRI